MKTLGKFIRSVPLATWALLLGFGLFLWLWIFGRQGLHELEHLRQAESRLLLQKEGLGRERGMLEKELKDLKDPETMRHWLRKDMGLIGQDEVLVQFK